MARGRISDDDIARVREATDLVALISQRTRVQQRGREFWCCCPLHHEKTPSFKIDPTTQLWHCFGCGEGGDVFGYLMKTEELTFPEAVRKLAEAAHIDIATGDDNGMPHSARSRLKDICAKTAEFYHLQLMRSRTKDAQAARDYLSSRDLGGSIPKTWELGFAPGGNALFNHLLSCGFKAEEMISANVITRSRDGRLRDRFYNRVLFPINDVAGECIAFGGRIIGQGEPKYLNSQETPIFHKSNVLYGLDKAKAKMASTGTAIVAEGYTDVIALHEAGFQNSVATLGTALTKNHIRLLSRHAGKRIVYLFDGDTAGQRATERALQFIDQTSTPESGRSRIEICALTLPDDLDPAEFLASHDAQELHTLIDDAKPLLEYGIEKRLALHDMGTSERRLAALDDALSILAPIKDSILAKDYAIRLASACKMREEFVLERLSEVVVRPDYDASQEEATQPARSQHAQRLPLEEANRLRSERELLSLVAQHPASALSVIDALSSLRWHDVVHDKIASSILSTLTKNICASPAEIIDEAARVSPHASSLLTTSTSSSEENLSTTLDYLITTLSIKDKEEEIIDLRAKLDAPHASTEESNALFAQLVEMQKQLSDMRSSLTSF